MVNIIVAVGNYVSGKGFPIGAKGGMPWHNKADLKWFKDMTTGHPVIMGRKTYESIGHPLKNRTNIIVTKNEKFIDGFNDGVSLLMPDIETAIDCAKKVDEEIFIIGGASIYEYALKNDLVDRMYVDMLAEEVTNADAFLPDIVTDNNWEEVGTAIEIEPRKAYASQYVKIRGQKNHVDDQYINLVNRIIKEGVRKNTRAGMTRSVFGVQLRFNLKEGLPMLTTKKMFAKGVIHELLWFLKGDTNIKYLVDNGVHIWDDDAYRYYLECRESFSNDESAPLNKDEYLEKVKNEESITFYYKCSGGETHTYDFKCGDLGPVYGKQWRNWESWDRVDQVADVIKKLRTNPDDRRIMISSWNPGDLRLMALPPCHYSCQFYTKELENGKRELSCMWQQRSVDTLLGLPFNILSYAILTHIIAQCVDMEVGELIFNGGDVHVYENQIADYEKQQKDNNPHMYALPELWLNPEIKEFEDFKYEDIKIVGYKSYPSIKYTLSVGL